MDAQAQVIDFLKLNGLPFELRQHPAVHTMDDCAMAPPSQAAQRLKVERLEEKSTAYSFLPISRPEHRNVPKGHFGAENVRGAVSPQAD